MGKKKERISSLEAIRIIAFFVIFSCHCGLNHMGAFGVSIFFVLSGFTTIYSHSNNNGGMNREFNLLYNIKRAIRRIKKLYPLHIITLVLIMPFSVLTLLDENNIHSLCIYVVSFILNVLLMQSLVPNEAIYFSYNGVSWFLSTLFIIYIIFPFLLHKKNHKTSIFMILILQLMISVLVDKLQGSGITLYIWSGNLCKWATYISPFYRVGDFLLGCHIALLYMEKKSNGKDKSYNLLKYSFIECITVFSVILSQVLFDKKISLFGKESFRYSLLFLIPSGLLIFLFANRNGVISQLLNKKIFAKYGKLTTYAYLIHPVVIRYSKVLFKHVLNNEMEGTYLLFVFSLIIIFILSLITDCIFSCLNCKSSLLKSESKI